MRNSSTTLALAVMTFLPAAIYRCGREPERDTRVAAQSAEQVQAPAYPAPRGYAQLVFHDPSGRMILFGGEVGGRRSANDTWAYDPRTNQWTNLTSDVHPADAGGATAAYDRESDRIVAYFSTRLDRSANRGLVRISETWTLDPTTGRWTNMHPDPAPFGLMGARVVYDSAADRVILFGGADFTRESAPRFDGTWAYDLNSNTWTERRPNRRPPGRSYFGMAYDSEARKTLIFGGSLGADAEVRAGEVWAYDYPSDTWEQVPYDGDVRPNHHPAMSYAPGWDKTLFLVRDGLWAFDYASRLWTRLAYDDAMGVRYYHAMAFDAASNQLVLFGGGPRGLFYDNETWVYDPRSNHWERRGPAERSLISQMRDALARGGVEAALALHRTYRDTHPVGTGPSTERMMNGLAYELLSVGRTEHAVAVLRMNADDYPESASAHDSLGEGLLALGDTAAAIAAWREALRLDPNFRASAANLRRLGIEP